MLVAAGQAKRVAARGLLADRVNRVLVAVQADAVVAQAVHAVKRAAFSGYGQQPKARVPPRRSRLHFPRSHVSTTLSP